jgi:hypothetical protein
MEVECKVEERQLIGDGGDLSILSTSAVLLCVEAVSEGRETKRERRQIRNNKTRGLPPFVPYS